QHAVLGGDAESGLVLQHASPQYLLDEDAVVDERRAMLARLGVERDLVPALDHELPLALQPEVRDHGRDLQESLSVFPQPLHRSELDLELARPRHIRIGRVERTVCKCKTCIREKRGGGEAENCSVQVPPSRSWAKGAELGRNAVLGSRESANTPTTRDSKSSGLRLQSRNADMQVRGYLASKTGGAGLGLRVPRPFESRCS